MVKTISKFELYNSQTTHYLQKKKEELNREKFMSSEMRQISLTIEHILEARDEWNQPRPCLWVCDWSCKNKCKNNF